MEAKLQAALQVDAHLKSASECIPVRWIVDMKLNTQVIRRDESHPIELELSQWLGAGSGAETN